MKLTIPEELWSAPSAPAAFTNRPLKPQKEVSMNPTYVILGKTPDGSYRQTVNMPIFASKAEAEATAKQWKKKDPLVDFVVFASV